RVSTPGRSMVEGPPPASLAGGGAQPRPGAAIAALVVKSTARAKDRRFMGFGYGCGCEDGAGAAEGAADGLPEGAGAVVVAAEPEAPGGGDVATPSSEATRSSRDSP